MILTQTHTWWLKEFVFHRRLAELFLFRTKKRRLRVIMSKVDEWVFFFLIWKWNTYSPCIFKVFFQSYQFCPSLRSLLTSKMCCLSFQTLFCAFTNFGITTYLGFFLFFFVFFNVNVHTRHIVINLFFLKTLFITEVFLQVHFCLPLYFSQQFIR